MNHGVHGRRSSSQNKYTFYTHVSRNAFRLEALVVRAFPAENNGSAHPITDGPSPFRRLIVLFRDLSLSPHFYAKISTSLDGQTKRAKDRPQVAFVVTPKNIIGPSQIAQFEGVLAGPNRTKQSLKLGSTIGGQIKHPIESNALCAKRSERLFFQSCPARLRS